MEKIILLLFILLIPFSFASSQYKNVGIAKYAVLEVKNDNTPLRDNDNENANRLAHLFKNAVLFADKENKDYYRVELNEKLYGFINKKFVDVQAIIPEKRVDNINKITFKETKDNFDVKIETDSQSAFIVEEEGNNLNFTLYDNHFDPIDTKIVNKTDNFAFSEKISNELEINFLNNQKLFGYDVVHFSKGYIFTIKKIPKINKKKPLKNITVVVDPGHGGAEAGACAFGLEEKNINLKISKLLKRELEKRGAKVYLTRKKDVKTGLYDRVQFSKEKNADILLSIHQNSLANPKDIVNKHGVGTYYYHNQSKPLAQAIQNNLIKATNFKDDKVNHASFALTRPTNAISVLIECGYIIRKEEAQKLADKNFQKIVARAIVKGCEDYLRDL